MANPIGKSENEYKLCKSSQFPIPVFLQDDKRIMNSRMYFLIVMDLFKGAHDE
jgi:hypothetical protein